MSSMSCLQAAWPRAASRTIASVMIVIALGVAMVLAPVQAAPKAGDRIGNQATASYTDAEGQTQTTTSNPVETIVAPVYALDLIDPRNQTVGTPGEVVFAHTVFNRGNDDDQVVLTVSNVGSGDDFEFSQIQIFADADQNGIPDDNIDLNGATVPVVYQGSYSFVVVAQVPAGQADDTSALLDVTATSSNDSAATDTNQDTATVSLNEAVFNVTKAMSQQQGGPGSGPYTVTLSYENSGTANSQRLEIRDALPAGMTYVAGSARWSVTGSANALTDASDGNEDVDGDSSDDGIDFTANTNAPSFVITDAASLQAGDTGFVTFEVAIDAGVAAGLELNNTAVFDYDNDDSGATDGDEDITGETSNTVTFTVLQSFTIEIIDTGVDDNPAQSDDDSTQNDSAFITSAQAGSTILFRTLVANQGDGVDTVNLVVTNDDFPPGTTFILLQDDGVTPLTSSDADSVPDTGPLAPYVDDGDGVIDAGDTGVYALFIRVILPSASGATDATATVTASSANEPGQSDTVALEVGSLVGATVDLTNNAPAGASGALGEGAAEDDNGNPWVTNPVDPVNATNPTTFSLYVTNTSLVSDRFNLSVSGLPGGWTVTFYRDDNGDETLDGGDTQTVSTGTLATGASQSMLAVVSVPQNFAPGDYDLIFRAESPNSGALDTKLDRVQVLERTVINIDPPGSIQTTPGGTVVYTHTISNDGNVAFTDVTIGTTDTDGDFSTGVFFDTNGNGVYDVGVDQPFADQLDTLGPGATGTIFVVVTAPGDAAPGQTNTTTVTVDATSATGGDSDSVDDITEIVESGVTLVKEQALDADCDGTADSGFQQTQIQQGAGAIPGACLLYRVTATNVGSTNIDDLIITDSTPANTTYRANSGSGGVCQSGATISVGTVTAEPADGGTGSITGDVGTLSGSTSVVLDFCIRIDPLSP